MATYLVYDGSAAPGAPYDDFDTNAAQSIDDLNTAVVLADGDIILCADDHVAGYGADPAIGIPASVTIISVDHTDQTIYKPGADERVVSGHASWGAASATSSKHIKIFGLRIGVSSNNTFYLNGYDALWELIDCLIYVNGGATSQFRPTASSAEAIDCTFYHNTSGTPISCWNTQQLTIRSCSFPNGPSGSLYLVAPGSSTYGQTKVLVEDCDLTNFTHLINSWGTQSAMDAVFRRCSLRSGYALVGSGTAKALDKVVLEHCAVGNLSAPTLGILSSSSRATGASSVQTTVRRSGGGSDGTQGWAYLLSSTAAASLYAPAVLENSLAVWHPADQSRTLTIYMCSNQAALYDDEVYAYVSHGDETNPATAEGFFIPTRAVLSNRAAADTSDYLKSDSSGWVNGEGYTKYKFVFAGINPTQPGWVVARIYLAKASTSLWVCPDVSLA